MLRRTAHAIARRTPFFYGHVVLGCAMCSSFARQAAAVATLSVFIVPMTAVFGWSRGEISGAVSLGGILAALVSPAVGRFVDRAGAQAVLVASAALIGLTALALAATHSLLWFYVFFSLGRMLFASPFDIAISAAVANWYLRGRAQAMAGVSLAAGLSLAAMPFIAQLAIDGSGWRAGWITVAVAAFLVGALPNALLMVRRPEDVGLAPDGAAAARAGGGGGEAMAPGAPEAAFSLRMALRTPALWLLMGYTALVFPVQAGVSLHQAPLMIEKGIDPTVAASIVSTFAAMAALSGLAFGTLVRYLTVRHGLALAATVMAVGATMTARVDSAGDGFLSAAVFGAGIGGIITLVPVSFADYFGRASYGSIRGVALPVQVAGQAMGPLLAGVLFDVYGTYDAALAVFAVLALAGAVTALAARPPHAAGG